MSKIFGTARWLLGLPPAKAVEPPKPATAFPRFRELPTEIRWAIWLYALPAPRIYEPAAPTDWLLTPMKPITFLRTFAPPVLREVCQEAYEVCMSEGEFRFGCFFSHMRGIWYNEVRDAIYFACEMQLDRTHIFEVDTIYLSADCALRSPDCRNFLMSKNFDFCDKLVIALYPPGSWDMDVQTLKGTEPIFRKIMDYEIIGEHAWDTTDCSLEQRRKWNSAVDGDAHNIIYWQRAKEVILGLFKMRQEAARLAGREHYEEDLELEAVEVFRKPLPKALPA
ncbi:hypothetical protein GCG54_00004892 [Colletotrichum gloeosporioides]|uniref:2EXR domain-containing protein n=1 Tax=Colletotrichum gloeosporioides TaxID=474922 RepID=A0A8H4CH29_COLGL|nr:uncharacterized protein GCG54_00004892 [Colletotrichum gloeosporioides]KAF3803714.1 hypothetical protein GCG54_00004892 [Colletotrichum gloeosporioides]